MKIFSGKAAAEDYMSTHTLAFSTPELTLTRFAFWLADIVPDRNNKDETVPRLMTYIEEKDFEPVQIIDDETFVPTGAIKQSSTYGNVKTDSGPDSKFCHECGGKISANAKFCTECGVTQQD